jgi:hypothetical protein
MPDAARGETGEAGLKLTNVANLASLVADIAARGNRPAAVKSRGQGG